MGMFSWLFGENKIVHTHLKAEPSHKYDSMVGEPVISFLESLEREPKRYKLEPALSECEYTGKMYPWMSKSGLCKVTDTKVGTVWLAYLNEKDLYSVTGLPFSLNHWELKAINNAFHSRRMSARIRRDRMYESARVRFREGQRVKELADRAAYAKQFQ